MKRRLLTTCPVSMPEEIRLSLALDAMHPDQPGFAELMAEIRHGLAALLGTAGPVPILAGTRETAMDAAVCSLFAPGEPVIVIETGEAGHLWTRAAGARNLDLILYRIPWNEPLTPERLHQAMALEPKAKAVLMAAADASTGVAHPVAQLAETCAARGMLSVFETSASLGAAPVSLDGCGADCFTAGCEQGLSLPPGLCLAALSERAWAKAKDVRPGSAVLDLTSHRKALEAGSPAHLTPPVNLLSGLAASLSLLAGHGPQTMFARRRAMAAMCRAGLTALGLAPAVTDSPASAATTFTLPDGIGGPAVLQALAEHHGVLLSPAAGPGRTALAIGHLGDTDYGDVLAGLAALGQTIAGMGGASPGNDYLSQAMRGYHDSIIEGA